MNTQEISKKLHIILHSEARGPTLYYAVKWGPKVGNREGPPELVTAEPERWEFRSSNVDLLRTLWFRLRSVENRRFFENRLRAAGHTSPKTLPLVVQFFVRIGRVEKACQILFECFRLNESWLDALGWLSENLRCEPYLFKDRFLDTLSAHVSNLKKKPELDFKKGRGTREMVLRGNVFDAVDRVSHQINEIQHIRLEQELLEDVNWEVNQDRNRVEERLRHFGFSKELSECLDEIEDDYAKAGTEFDFKSCMDRVRSFVETLNKELVAKVESKSGARFKGDYTKAGNVRDYFKKKGVDFVTQTEYELYTSLYGLVSDLGVHKLTSEREFARISKNMVIELALLLLDRLEGYLGQ